MGVEEAPAGEIEGAGAEKGEEGLELMEEEEEEEEGQREEEEQDPKKYKEKKGKRKEKKGKKKKAMMMMDMKMTGDEEVEEAPAGEIEGAGAEKGEEGLELMEEEEE